MTLNKFKFFILFIIILLLISILFFGCTKKHYIIWITKARTTENYNDVRKIIDIGDKSIRFIDKDGKEIFISDSEITKIEVFTRNE